MAEAKPSFPWPAGKRAAVSLTFDDARLSQVDRGLAILDARGVKATFYVSPANLARRLEGWRAAVAAGHEIGNHTMTHPCSGNFPFARANALEDCTLERMETELLNANAECDRLLGVVPTTFAYPCGQSFVGRGESLKSYIPLVAKHFIVGRGAFSEIHNDPSFCDLAHVTGLDADGKSFEQLKGMVDRAADAGAWLVLFGHDVGEGGHQVTRADALDALCRYCREEANGIWIDTVAAIGRYVSDKRRP
ncbi:MAG: polysaccharide deacetylase [Planctomycetes bacterium]|nr:polysaccharide deacetylase [Planctomycetota bacterium]